MKYFKLNSYIVFFFLISVKIAHSADKIAILDFDMLLEKTNYGKKIISDLNILNEQNLNSLKQLESKIKLDQENINKQKNLLSDDELKKKLNKYNSDVVEFQKKKNSLANIFNLEKKKKLDEFFKKIIPEIERYIDDKNISLVYDKKNVFIANKKNNITEEIIKIINEKLKWVKN